MIEVNRRFQLIENCSIEIQVLMVLIVFYLFCMQLNEYLDILMYQIMEMSHK